MPDGLADGVPPRLVVVDAQVVFADPASPWAAPGFARVLDALRALVAAFGDRVVWTRFVAPAAPTGAWADYYAQWPFALQPPDAPLWDVVPELAPLAAGHPVVTATTFGKWGPELAAALGGASEVVLAGVSTDCCVLSTALAMADAGVRVRVAADACAGVTDADHERALAAMRLYAPLVDVTDSRAVLGSSRAG